MYFIIKYNVFNKYIINVTTTGINTCKKIFEFAQREVISFFTSVTNKGEPYGYVDESYGYVDESCGYVDESYGYVDESYGYVDESYGYGSHIYTGLSKRLLCPDRMIL
jgi:hypothetical protein